VQAVNASLRSKAVRKTMETVLGIHHDRTLPEYDSATFRSTARPNGNYAIKDGERTPGKVAIYATCYINYNEPGIGHDLVAILAHNEIAAVLVEKEACCGMPKLELGDLEAVERLKKTNIAHLARLARGGYAILTAVPSCTLMYKQELPLMFPEDEDVQVVKEAMWDPFEYLMARNADGLLKTDFKVALGKVSYHAPCHQRVQNVGAKTRDALRLAGAEVNLVERCSGHDGTWGVKTEFFANSMKIVKPVAKSMAQTEPDYVASDCAIAARHILQGMGETKAEKRHPISLLRLAYGI
ncbi:MAG: heterodisulfide reductase-related iron-sulfur binding cluster, partial [Thiobacillaceae bacterium]